MTKTGYGLDTPVEKNVSRRKFSTGKSATCGKLVSEPKNPPRDDDGDDDTPLSQRVRARYAGRWGTPAAKLKLPLKIPKKKGKSKIPRMIIRRWKREAQRKRINKKKTMTGVHTYVRKLEKTKKGLRPKGALPLGPRRGPLEDYDRSLVAVTLPPRRVFSHAVPTTPPSKLEALLGVGNYRRIARASGFTNVWVRRVLGLGSNCSFYAAAQIADAAGVTLDELRIYQEIRRNILAKAKKSAE